MYVCILGLAKRDLWGLGAEPLFLIASYAFAKMILQCTEVHFAHFLSGGFITGIVVNPPERRLAKRTSVHWLTPVWRAKVPGFTIIIIAVNGVNDNESYI